MLIREMKESDIGTIVEIEKQIFTSPWSKDNFLYEITKNQFSRYLVLEKENRMIGYIGFWLLGDQTQITSLGIKEEEQGQGYARILMDACVHMTIQHKYQNITLEVRVSNTKAIRLYEQYGFTIVAIRKNYYQDTHEDAYLMLKEMEV